MNLPDRLKDLGIVPLNPNEKQTIFIPESKLLILDKALRDGSKDTKVKGA